jgi:hypothetical protein
MKQAKIKTYQNTLCYNNTPSPSSPPLTMERIVQRVLQLLDFIQITSKLPPFPSKVAALEGISFSPPLALPLAQFMVAPCQGCRIMMLLI